MNADLRILHHFYGAKSSNRHSFFVPILNFPVKPLKSFELNCILEMATAKAHHNQSGVNGGDIFRD